MDYIKQDKSESHKTKQTETQTLVIGYYPIRGKAQVPRLLCEYLNVQYQDKLYQLKDIKKFKKTKAKSWDFQDVPFLQEGDFVITQAHPMAQYIIQRFGDVDLLGRNQADKAIILMYLWTIETMGSIINIYCLDKNQEEIEKIKNQQWSKTVLPRLQKYQSFVKGDQWFMGYITIIDFSIYQLLKYMEMLFPSKTLSLVKLTKIKNMIYNIPRIKNYQNSQRAIIEMDPSTLIKKFKESQD